MKKISRRPSKKIVIIIVAIIALLAAGGAWYTFTQMNSADKNTDSINYDEPTAEQSEAGSQTKQNAVDVEKPATSGSDTPPAPTPNEGTSTSSVEVATVASNQNGSMYQMRFLISALANSGTCTLTLTQGSRVVTKTASVQPQSSTSTCRGFDIPVNELGPGQWQATMTFNNTTLSGTTTSTITVQ